MTSQEEGGTQGRRIIDGVLTLAQVVIEAVLFACIAAALVYLLPAKFALLVFALYALICVGLFQLAAVSMLGYVAARAVLSGDSDMRKTALICGGYLIAVSLVNAFLLALAHLWGRSFAVAPADIPLAQFLTIDARVWSVAFAVFAVVGDFLDHIAASVLHLAHAPLATLFAHSASLSLDGVTQVALMGLASGLAVALLVRVSR